MKKRTTLKQLKFSYIVSVCVILCLLFTTQIIIQLTLKKETETRALSGQVSLQALRAPLMLKNTLELVITPGNKTFSGLLQKDMQKMIPEEQWLLNGALPANAVDQLKSIDKYFQIMIKAGNEIVLDTNNYDAKNKTRLKDQGRASVDLFNAETLYLPGIVAVSTSLSTEADILVFRVQLAEICLFFLSVSTVFAEYLFIARPGIRSAQDIFNELEDKMTQIGNQQTTPP